MKSKKLNNGYIIKLEKGEEIIQSLTLFCIQNKIKSGQIAGIGGTNNISLKYFNLKKNVYITKTFKGRNYEILTLNGNISLVDKKPFLHIHTTIGDSDYKVYGGHLESAIIGITCEITITMTGGTIKRKLDKEFQLKFLDL
jgi:uncharacterized protein